MILFLVKSKNKMTEKRQKITHDSCDVNISDNTKDLIHKYTNNVYNINESEDNNRDQSDYKIIYNYNCNIEQQNTETSNIK